MTRRRPSHSSGRLSAPPVRARRPRNVFDDAAGRDERRHERKKQKEQKEQKKTRKGHGRHGTKDYSGARRVPVPHESLRAGDACPKCPRGKVYRLKEPAVIVRITGTGPLQATVHELERLRCNLCGEVFRASAPEGIREARYDAKSRSMIALLKYGSGLPFNRLAGLQRNLGVPLPPSTQWDLVRELATDLDVVYRELINRAADGEVLHNDDTSMRVLELMSDSRAGEDEDEYSERSGIFTSGIISSSSGPRIALFFTGRKHAGENLADVLAERSAELNAPIQMCDALSRNTSPEFSSIVANCLAHGRRHFVDVAANFPEACRHVLDELGVVYGNDATARTEHMFPEQRLAFHQRTSGPVMDELHAWMTDQFERRQVEPNSGLGRAIKYMLWHWQQLTLFLRVAGAPLDNNVCERALKRAILHRKNALFYRSMVGEPNSAAQNVHVPSVQLAAR